MGYLIFGASGFLGSAIVDWLENKQEKITVSSNSQYLEKLNNGDLINYSKFTDNELEELISNHHTIIDASGISSNKKNFPLKRFIESNASWPYRLAKLSIKSNRRYIWLSTIHCEKYDNKIQVNIDNYSLSKYIGELLIKTLPGWEKRILIIRLGNIIGSPGKIYKGNYDLFSLDIALNFFSNNRAEIKSNLDTEIKVSSLLGFLEFIYEERYGFINYSPIYKLKLKELAYLIKYSYKKITKKDAKLFSEGNQIDLSLVNKKFNFLDNDLENLLLYLKNKIN